MAGTRLLLAACGAVVALTLASCGGDDTASGPGTDLPEPSSAGWWTLDAEGFTLLGGGLTPEDIADSTGHLWTLEYSNGPQTLQLSAWKEESRFAETVERYPTVGAAQVMGYAVTLYRGEGIPADEIPPSVMALWADGDRLIGFGGGGLSEEEVRSFLAHMDRVTRSEWNAVVNAMPKPPPPPTPTSMGN